MNKVFIVREKVEYTDNYERDGNRDEIIGAFTGEKAAVAFMRGSSAGCRDTLAGRGLEFDFNETDRRSCDLTAYFNGEVNEEWKWSVEEHEIME